jgi:glycosyltransferase involved in cell wall biosynthesis
MDVTVLICTRNRAHLLGETLDEIAKTDVPPTWSCEVLVVDNGSTDGTRAAVLDRIEGYPMPLRYVSESAPGKSNALNTGIAATAATVIACTDDDVRVCREWVRAACAPLLDPSSNVAYTGGPVEPIWDSPCPRWFPRTPSDLWGMIAILDYGPKTFIFEVQQKVPLGANFAFRRELFERLGGFLPALGRTATRTLMGQELPEFLRRVRAAGAHGIYVPDMRVFHHIPAGRLTPSYSRRWWFGKGVSRARVDRLHPITELGVDLGSTPHIAGVPRFMIGSACRNLGYWAAAAVRRDMATRVRVEARLCYFAGYLWERQRERRQAGTVNADATRPTATQAASVVGNPRARRAER